MINKFTGWVIIVSIILIIVFYGDPVSWYLSKNRIEKYLGEKYPNIEFVVESFGFNFVNRDYSAKIYPKENPDVLFLVNISSNSIKDNYMQKKIEMETKKAIIPLINKVDSDITVNVSISQNSNGATIDLIIVNMEGFVIDKEIFTDKALKIRNILNENDIKFKNLIFNKYNQTQTLELSIEGNNEISKDEIINNIRIK